MKKITYLLFTSVMILTGCSEDYTLEDNGLSVKELPAYVSWSAPGASTTIADVDTSEDAGLIPLDSDTDDILNIEVPGGTLSDVTVNFTFSGTAIFGVDFNVDGATASGGSIIIIHKQSTNPDDYNFVDNVDFNIELLTDGITDGTKTLEITLVDATNSEGSLAIGRGGLEILRTAIVNISDID